MKYIKNRFFPIIIVLLIFIGGIYLAYIYTFSERAGQSKVEVPMQISGESRAKVETYVKERISELSPEPEVLGGKFYVTKVTFLTATKALVEYEDGHNAFKAEFDFFIDPLGTVSTLNFKVIQRN